mgnify:CR=1 FL=1|tara:strand:+ start:35 stop:1492 length:1458 start_codon:yes stop_codon:yes gene_type:complete
MALTIEQQPLYNTLPVGQDIMFTLKEDVIVVNKYNVKFVAQVYIDDGVGLFILPQNLVATLKVTPNNRGVGIFSLNSILESYVEPQQEGVDFGGYSFSQFQGINYSLDNPHPIHLIDKFACNKKVIKYFQIGFNIEYTDTLSGSTINSLSSNLNSEQYLFFNGVLDEDDVLKLQNNNYGYNLNLKKLVMNSNQCNFLTNAPTIQYARLTDYGTFSFLNFLNVGTNSFQVGTNDATINMVKYVQVNLYDSSGGALGSAIEILSVGANGGWNTNNNSAHTRVMFAGIFPANLDGWSTIWATHKANVSYYTVQAFDDEDENMSQTYTINIINNPCKGYEAIRLTWLNQYGTWDYYTFNKKSVKSLQTQRTSYTQQSGTWNNTTYRINGYKGGEKNFRVNSKQLITVNTDFLIESEAVWFENLINSTEVYMLNGYDTYSNITNYGMTNKFVIPVTLTTSNYVTKTIANDKLIQYTINLEKSNNKRTQSV